MRFDLGTATANDMTREATDLLRRKQFPIFRTQGVPAPLIQTEWRNQTPTEDEAAQGVVEVRSRILVRGRERASTTSKREFVVTLTMENQVKEEAGGGWIEIPITPQRTRKARQIARELELSLQAIRR